VVYYYVLPVKKVLKASLLNLLVLDMIDGLVQDQKCFGGRNFLDGDRKMAIPVGVWVRR
jgi:hypothetical protein